MESNQIVFIVDYGSQYTFLIAKRLRNLHCYCEIIHPSNLLNNVSSNSDKRIAIILSGGPNSV